MINLFFHKIKKKSILVWYKTTTSGLKFDNARQKSKGTVTEARLVEMTTVSFSTMCFKFWRD
jgi:hypothetical protein